jgi:hypothetical protein
MMMAVDEAAARQLMCEAQHDEASLQSMRPGGDVACDAPVADAQTDAEAPIAAASNAEPRDGSGRRKRR